MKTEVGRDVHKVELKPIADRDAVRIATMDCAKQANAFIHIYQSNDMRHRKGRDGWMVVDGITMHGATTANFHCIPFEGAALGA